MCVLYHKVYVVGYKETHIQVMESWYKYCKVAYVILHRLIIDHQMMVPALFSGAVIQVSMISHQEPLHLMIFAATRIYPSPVVSFVLLAKHNW